MTASCVKYRVVQTSAILLLCENPTEISWEGGGHAARKPHLFLVAVANAQFCLDNSAEHTMFTAFRNCVGCKPCSIVTCLYESREVLSINDSFVDLFSGDLAVYFVFIARVSVPSYRSCSSFEEALGCFLIVLGKPAIGLQRGRILLSVSWAIST